MLAGNFGLTIFIFVGNFGHISIDYRFLATPPPHFFGLKFNDFLAKK